MDLAVPSQPGADTGQLVGVVVGVLVAALSLVLIVILVIFLVLKRSQKLYDVPVLPQPQTDIDSTIYSQIIDSQGIEVKNNEAYSPSTAQQIPTEDNVAYGQITPQISTEDNVAYGQITPQITTEDNVAYDQIAPQIPTEDNIAYDQAAASQLQIPTEDNVASGHREDDYATVSDPTEYYD